MGVAENSAENPKMEKNPTEEVDFVLVAGKKRNEPKFWRVPGSLPAVGQMAHERANKQSELKKKNVPQLKEIKERQERLLANKSLLQKLPDRGEKARLILEEVTRLLEEREQEDSLARQMERLTLPDTTAMEWRGRRQGGEEKEEDGDGTTLRLLASVQSPHPANPAADIELYAVQKMADIDTRKMKTRFMPFSYSTSSQSDHQSSTPPPPSTTITATTDSTPPTLITSTKLLAPSTSTSSLSSSPSSSSAPANSKSSPSMSSVSPRTPGLPSLSTRTPAIPLPSVYSCSSKLISLQESLELQLQQAKTSRELSLAQARSRLEAANSSRATTAAGTVTAASLTAAQSKVVGNGQDNSSVFPTAAADHPELPGGGNWRNNTAGQLDSDDSDEEGETAADLEAETAELGDEEEEEEGDGGLGIFVPGDE